MTPDDPRHGTYAGYTAGCHDDCCLVANRRYTKRLLHDHYHGKRRTIDATGFTRRIRALQALGWSVEDVAAMVGLHGSNLRRDMVRNKRVTVARHNTIAELYEQLCMTVADGPHAGRLRGLAAARGYLPPLAWDDIDDPNERPDRGTDSRRDTLAEYRWLIAAGESHHAAITRLGITDNGLERAIYREKEAA